MAGFAHSPLTGSSWNDLAGQTALATKDELDQREKMRKQRMLADPMTGQSAASSMGVPGGGMMAATGGSYGGIGG